MGIGWLLGGIGCIGYFFLVAVAGGIKKSPAILKLVKMKLNKNMSDETAAKVCLVFGIIVGIGGAIALFVIGALRA